MFIEVSSLPELHTTKRQTQKSAINKVTAIYEVPVPTPARLTCPVAFLQSHTTGCQCFAAHRTSRRLLLETTACVAAVQANNPFECTVQSKQTCVGNNIPHLVHGNTAQLCTFHEKSRRAHNAWHPHPHTHGQQRTGRTGLDYFAHRPRKPMPCHA